ncbi:MAG: ferritin-like domain-containing protein [Rhodospirillaceae bacterium]|nr:ferritin-like domain-containing protein [Rhodospirillaceae bacterium]
MGHWTLDDIPWRRFDAAKVEPDILAIVKAASVVERNGADYETYLCNVFHDDPEFQAAAREWAGEEVQHGLALARWAQLADAGFDPEKAFQRFVAGFRPAIDATQSIRGSRAGELIARCVVETGTSSYYTALGDATDEPVLKAICRKIAADEHRHYKLFYTHMKRYLAVERLGLWRRLRIGFGRLLESEDDELAYAYYAANASDGPYRRRLYTRAYARRAYALYRPRHIERAVAMLLKAVGLAPHGLLGICLARLFGGIMNVRAARLARAGI